MAQLFTREGSTEFQPLRCEPGERPQGVIRRSCGRCGGRKYLDAYRHIEGGICFGCGGSGRGEDLYVKLYTAEELEKLNARKAKAGERRAAKARAKAEAEHEARQAATRARFERLKTDPVAVRLRAFEGRSEFVAKILDTLAYSDLTEAQETAALAACDKIEADDARKAASAHVGEIGERVKFTGSVEFARCLHVAEGYWDRDRWLVKLRTAEGASLTWFTSCAPYADGTEVSGSFTVKAHGEYKGEKTTTITNPRIKATRA